MALLGLGGCGGPSLVGKWSTKLSDLPLELEFKQGGQFEAKGRYLTVEVAWTGMWDEQRGTLTLTPQQVDAHDPSNVVPKEMIERAKLLFQPELLKPRTGKLVWAGNDLATFTQTDDGTTLRLERIKPPQ